MHQGDVQDHTSDADVKVHVRVGGHCPSTKGDKITFTRQPSKVGTAFTDAVIPDSQARPANSQAIESCAKVQDREP